MRCLVFVRFMPEGSLPPEDFFARLNSKWSWLGKANEIGSGYNNNRASTAALCITDYESIEQLTLDLAIMPGAGISNIEIVPISEEPELAEKEEVGRLKTLNERTGDRNYE